MCSVKVIIIGCRSLQLGTQTSAVDHMVTRDIVVPIAQIVIISESWLLARLCRYSLATAYECVEIS